MNNALLAKLAWLVASKRDSLCMSILKAKYRVRDDWLRREPPKSASPVWKAIEGVKEIIVKGACYLIGDGASINVWLDLWAPWIPNFIPKPAQPAFAKTPLAVSMLINGPPKCWNESLIHHLFEHSSAEAILSIPLASHQSFDKLIWVPCPKGEFAVKSAYKVANPILSQSPLSDQLWRRLWKIKVPERIKMLLWRIALNSISVKEILAQRMGLENQVCELCHEAT